MSLKSIFVSFFVLNILFLAAQDSLRNHAHFDSTHIRYYLPKGAFSQRDTLALDTTLFQTQRYDPRTKELDISATTITLGGPVRNLYFKEMNSSLQLGESYLQPYFYTNAALPRYSNVKVPYSEIFYTIGPQAENALNGVLAAQPNSQLYYGTDFAVQSTVGLFYNQRVVNSHFRGIAQYNTLNNRYSVEFQYIYNKMKFGENGGITYDTYYTDSTKFTRGIIPVNLNSAHNQVRSHYISLNQYYNLGYRGNDSTQSRYWAKAYLKTQVHRRNRIYFDENWNDSYYQNAFKDTVRSYDSLFIGEFITDFGFTNFEPKKHQYIVLDFGLAYRYQSYYEGVETYFFNYLQPHADMLIDFYKVNLEAGFKYMIKVENQQTFNWGANDFNLYGKLNFPLSKQIKWTLGMKMDLVSPEIMAYRLSTNHFMWQNSYDKQKHLEFNATAFFKGYQLEGALHTLNDYQYFDSISMPQQYSGSLAVLAVQFKKRFKFKGFGTDLMGLYQQSSNLSVLPLPKWTAKANIYFSFPLFKGALIVHPGFDVTLMQAYYAAAYNPVLMNFYNQNTTQLDRQFWVDFYINFKIKRARVFVKYQNLASLLGDYNYFTVPHYPMQDAVFKIGVSWKFFD